MNTKHNVVSVIRKPRRKHKTSITLPSVPSQQFELIDSIQQLLHAISIHSILQTELIHCGFENASLTQQDRIAIYLIVRAQIRSILLYRKVGSVSIHLAKNHEMVAIVIEDNGRCTDVEKLRNTRDLKIIQNLVTYHKGKSSISAEEGGTVLEVLLKVLDRNPY